jgi:hypothetical protein
MSEPWELTFDELDELKRYEPVERDVRVAHEAQVKLWEWLEGWCEHVRPPTQFTNRIMRTHRYSCQRCRQRLEAAMKGEGRCMRRGN